ncbi:MAG: LysR family transcriptional regulator [Pseudolabrys sp.]
MIGGLRSLDSVGAVLATRRAGTPAKAAKLLGQAPSTVYRTLDRLEEEIGLALFERAPAGWRPTPAGERVAQLAEAMETEIAAAERFMLGEGRGFPAPLRISASDGMAEGYLAPLLARFAAAQGVTVELVVDNHFADLGRNEAHIAIRPDQKPGEGLVGRRAGKLAHALYGATALLRRRGMPKTVAELDGMRACLLSERLTHHTAATWWTPALRQRVSVALVANTEMSLAAAIAAGAGIGVLPCFLGDRLRSVKRIAAVPVASPVDIWIVTHAALRQNPTVMGLILALADGMRRDRAKFAGAGR